MIYQKLYILFLVFFTMVGATVQAEDVAEGKKSKILSARKSMSLLEKEWESSHQASYFHKALDVFTEVRPDSKKADVEYYTVQLDIASSMLLKRCDGSEFGEAAISMRICQAAVIDWLVCVDVQQLNKLTPWPELRARYARLLMLQRAIWVSLRNPMLDDERIETDSTHRMKPDPDAPKREARNREITLQIVLKRFLKKTGPAIDRFMVDAFSMEPWDFQMMNEMLAIGLYTPAERAKLVTAAAGDNSKLPESLRNNIGKQP